MSSFRGIELNLLGTVCLKGGRECEEGNGGGGEEEEEEEQEGRRESSSVSLLLRVSMAPCNQLDFLLPSTHQLHFLPTCHSLTYYKHVLNP